MLDRKTSLAVGLGTAALVYGVYDLALPEIVNARAAEPNDPHLSAAEKSARWVSGALVVGIAVIARDAIVFIMGGGMVIGMSWLYRHANCVDPTTASALLPSMRTSVHTGDMANAGVSVAG